MYIQIVRKSWYKLSDICPALREFKPNQRYKVSSYELSIADVRNDFISEQRSSMIGKQINQMTSKDLTEFMYEQLRLCSG